MTTDVVVDGAVVDGAELVEDGRNLLLGTGGKGCEDCVGKRAGGRELISTTLSNRPSRSRGRQSRAGRAMAGSPSGRPAVMENKVM